MPRKPRRSISPSVSISRLSRVITRTAHCATYPTVMQAWSAASRCSCGLANRFVPPQFAGFVDIDRKPARHALSADLKALDLRTATRLALPCRGDAPVGLGLRSAPLGAVDQGKQIVEIDRARFVKEAF